LQSIALAVAATVTGVSTVAHAKAKVEITDVSWPGAPKDKGREKSVVRTLRRLATAASAHLDFGSAGKARVKLSLKRFELTEEEGLLRLSCEVVGKLDGGGTARSKIRLGAKPENRKKLERQALSATSDSVMVRLAEMAKANAPPPPKHASRAA